MLWHKMLPTYNVVSLILDGGWSVSDCEFAVEFGILSFNIEFAL